MPHEPSGFLEVPKALTGRRSRSRDREGRHSQRSGNLKSTSPTRGRLKRATMPTLHQRPMGSPPPARSQTLRQQAMLDPSDDIMLLDHTVKSGSHASQQGQLRYGLLSPSPSPPLKPSTSLRERLIGTWRLESYIAYPTPSSPFQRPRYPMTKAVTGLIMYALYLPVPHQQHSHEQIGTLPTATCPRKCSYQAKRPSPAAQGLRANGPKRASAASPTPGRTISLGLQHQASHPCHTVAVPATVKVCSIVQTRCCGIRSRSAVCRAGSGTCRSARGRSKKMGRCWCWAAKRPRISRYAGSSGVFL